MWWVPGRYSHVSLWFALDHAFGPCKKNRDTFAGIATFDAASWVLANR